MNKETKSWYYDYIERPKEMRPDDFWGQVRRTIKGEPFPQEQIEMITDMIRQALCFQADDVLLDICCGNGRLGFEFFDEIHQYLGVDLSPILIEIAKKNFERPLTHQFLLQNVVEYCQEEMHPEKFTKLLCYGSIQYFSQAQITEVFTLINKRFTGLKRLFIGPVPDKEKAGIFFAGKEALPINNPTSCIGLWHTKDGFKTMLKAAGWEVVIPEMPVGFCQANYRFNVILVRR